MRLATLIGQINRSIDTLPSAADLVHEVRRHVGAAVLEDEFVVECVERMIGLAERCLRDGEPYGFFHTDEQRSWKIALFLWDPSFRNTPHQHNTWSVSGVMCNEIEVSLYEATEDGPLSVRRRFVASRGESGYLIPPCIHALGNPHPTRRSVTLHVFALNTDRTLREHDTVWFDDVKPPDFYRDPRRPAQRDLLTALVLLKQVRTHRAPELLERVFRMADLQGRLEAYKQMARHDSARAVSMGDELLGQLRGSDRERFADLHARVRALRSAIVAPATSMADEYALQHAVGCLMRSPGLTDEVLARGVAVALPELPAAAAGSLRRILQDAGGHFRILSRIFDDRVNRDVLRLLPMSAAVLGEADLGTAWRAFERRHAATHWEHLPDAAAAFCAETAEWLNDDPLPRRRLARDLLRYEESLFRLGTLASEHRKVHIDECPPVGPRVTPIWRVLSAEHRLAALLPALRKAVALEGKARTAAVDAAVAAVQRGEFSLLLYVPRAGGPVNTMPVGALTCLLLAACNGSRGPDELVRHLTNLGHAGLSVAVLATALEKLEKSGVVDGAAVAQP